MKKIIPEFCLLIILSFTSTSISQEKEIVIDDYKSGLSSKWEAKIFYGETQYTVTTKDNISKFHIKE